VNQISPTSDAVQAQVEALTLVAKKLNGEGKEAEALEAYKTAAGLMLGAPWLQQRTAELARKLQQLEVATLHYRRAAAAFIRAGFPKRALGPLRTAWQVTASRLPSDPKSFIAVSLELAKVQQDLGLPADARLAQSSANQALRAAGCSERVPNEMESEPSSSRPAESGEKPSASASSASDPRTRLGDAVKP
jgi:hypothetical protein